MLVDMAIPTYESLRLRLRHGVTPKKALITSLLQVQQLSGPALFTATSDY